MTTMVDDLVHLFFASSDVGVVVVVVVVVVIHIHVLSFHPLSSYVLFTRNFLTTLVWYKYFPSVMIHF